MFHPVTNSTVLYWQPGPIDHGALMVVYRLIPTELKFDLQNNIIYYTLRPEQKWHTAENIYTCISVNEYYQSLIWISLSFVSKGSGPVFYLCLRPVLELS